MLEGLVIQNVSGGDIIPYCPDTDAIANQEGKADYVTEPDRIYGPVDARAACSESNLDAAGLSVGLEIVLSRPPSDCSMSVKRKTLDFDDGEKCSLNETFNPIMEKERLDKSSGKRCTVVKSATSLDKVTFDDPCRKSLEMQSLEQEVSNKREEPSRVSFETCVEECVVVDEEVSELDINKNLQNAEDNSDAVVEIQNFPFSQVVLFWDRISSNSSSSGKQRSLNPELTCFPIEEDPSISGENENIDEVADTIQENISSTLMTCAKRQPLAEIKEACVNPPTSVSAAERFPDRNSLDSTNTEVSATGAQSRIKQKLGNCYSNKRRCTNDAKENRSLSVSTNCIKKATESLNNRFSKPKLSGKTSLRKGGQNLLERESKHNNIVSNITSFLPLVQQKQAAAVGTGKRDIKVKALEAAEAAKRLEEKRQNERKMKKDALKLERERKEQENLRQMEINKKKKEEEQKKKDADMAARKRLREEEERKEKERKRKRIEEPRQQQRGKEEKLRAGKEKEVPFGAMDENVNDGKESNNELRKHQKMKKPQTDPRAAEISTSNASQVILEDCQAFSHFGDNGEPMSVFTKTAEKDSFMAKTSLEKSYSISPYQCSDDEEDEEDERDEIRTKKFVPSWASKNSVALVLSSQQKVDPCIIFPPESFCSTDEVLRPQKLQPK